jgi:hypothetical protein
MEGKTLLASGRPITQRIDAVKALLAWKQVSCDPLPEFVEMGDGDSRLVLVLSNKKDAYYTVTANGCSCPAATYHHGPCKHQRKYFPQPKKSREELEAEGEAILEAHHNTAKRLARPPESSSIRDNLPGWSGGHNGPVEA